MLVLKKVQGAAFLSIFTRFLVLAGSMGSLLLIHQAEAMDTKCFPALDEKQPQYVVAYGRMMHETLRSNALQKKSTGQLPVWVSGFQRGWMTRLKREGSYTSLGVAPEAGKLFNGILVEAGSGIINAHDRTEQRMCRTRLDRKMITSMTGQVLPGKGEFWIYSTKPEALGKPAGKYPMLMSEVDEFLTGCIEQAKQFNLTNFPEQCIESTDGWSSHWTNDRERPMTGRLVQVKRSQVDKLLSKMKGGLYEKVRSQ